MHWFVACLKKYAVFSGRSRRAEFWYFYLFAFLFTVGVQLIEAGVTGSEDGTIAAIFTLAVVIPSIAVGVRRLHDMDKSGWWQLLNFVPFFGQIALLIWMCYPGTKGPNRFGDDPTEDGHGSGETPELTESHPYLE